MFTMTIKDFSLDRDLVNYFNNLSQNVVSFVKDNVKLSDVSNGSKMLVITALFTVLPVNTMKVEPVKAYDTNLKLNNNNPLAIVSKENKASLVIGESDFDKQAREKQASLAQAKKVQKPVVVASIYNDPSDFRALYMAAGKQFGVPWQLLEAVHYVESGKSGSTARRSGAGAQGPMQFMPGTWRAYGVDGNGDGVIDANDVSDAIFGAAKLLAAGGAAEGNIDGALFNYNHAQWYVNKVKALAYESGM